MPILGTLTAYLNIHNSSDSKYETALSQALEEVPKSQNKGLKWWRSEFALQQTLRSLICHSSLTNTQQLTALTKGTRLGAGEAS